MLKTTSEKKVVRLHTPEKQANNWTKLFSDGQNGGRKPRKAISRSYQNKTTGRNKHLQGAGGLLRHRQECTEKHSTL